MKHPEDTGTEASGQFVGCVAAEPDFETRTNLRFRGSVDLFFKIAALVGLVLWLDAFPAHADDDDLDQGRVFAVQARHHRMNQEFTLSLGFLPMDAFYKFFAIGGHYVIHFNDLWAWEAIHFSFAKYLVADTGLKGQLAARWDVQPTDTPKIDGFLDTNLMIKPTYGKIAVLDDAVVFGETYLLLGLGTFKFDRIATFPIAVNIGLGFRIFFSDTISIRLEARDYVIIDTETGKVDNVLSFGFGFAYNAFAEERKIERSILRKEGEK